MRCNKLFQPQGLRTLLIEARSVTKSSYQICPSLWLLAPVVGHITLYLLSQVSLRFLFCNLLLNGSYRKMYLTYNRCFDFVQNVCETSDLKKNVSTLS